MIWKQVFLPERGVYRLWIGKNHMPPGEPVHDQLLLDLLEAMWESPHKFRDFQLSSPENMAPVKILAAYAHKVLAPHATHRKAPLLAFRYAIEASGSLPRKHIHDTQVAVLKRFLKEYSPKDALKITEFQTRYAKAAETQKMEEANG